jgi:hypothetical protein
MKMDKIFKFGGRTLSLSSLAPLKGSMPNEGYVVLLPAYSQSEIVASLSFARPYMSSLCKEFCCVGAKASQLEDQIDAVLEDVELYVPTTAFSDTDDACNYFLYAADAGVARLLFAPICDHNDLVVTLSAMANASQLGT